MSLELVTGYAGASHVSSADMGAFNAGIVGTGRYVLPIGSQFELGWSTNSMALVLNDGDAVDQGRHMRIPNGDTEIITLSNGASGMLRTDIICLQYTLDATTGIESAAVVVVEGTPGSSYTEPTLDQGNILEGDDHDLMPLYRVKISNYSIASVDKLFTMYEGNGDLRDQMITDIALNGTTITKTDGAVNIPLASSAQAGAMSAAQAAKLDSAVTNAVNGYAFVMASGWTNNGSYVRRTGKLVMIRFNFINTAALTKAVVTPVQFDSTVISKIAPLADVDNVIGIYSGTNTIGTCRARITTGGAVTFLPSVEVPANGYFQGSLVYIANSD